MALTAPATGTLGVAVAASSIAASEGGNKVTARAVRLGVPALPPLPSSGLSHSRGQPRGASFCKRMARNVVSMAVGEPSAPLADNEQLTEFLSALKQEWDGIENKFAATTVAIAVVLGMWSAGGVVSAIDKLPVVPGVMELVGTGYSAWFAYRNLLFKPDRDDFFRKINNLYEDIISG